jgi:hypothetical protein
MSQEKAVLTSGFSGKDFPFVPGIVIYPTKTIQMTVRLERAIGQKREKWPDLETPVQLDRGRSASCRNRLIWNRVVIATSWASTRSLSAVESSATWDMSSGDATSAVLSLPVPSSMKHARHLPHETPPQAIQPGRTGACV